MVEYHEWISIASAVAKQSYGSPTFEQHGENTKVFAEVWNRRKAELKRASKREATDIAEAEL